ncbi:hypothetical protein TRFO_33015 [Tritrichomonas foetus]|uniref:Uncharacterized protein n=1 Tax=Tritrichomonas foetus TaxID=1144522 RepID=A0A1J4JNR4_9EUKA|nr:hypothetical protein TRFO_33015 [Tritrichomonas foetus]|eukprot:OHT00362.1 hypothetical protein TRFO_33015 [Tritrichomonas foetus]
MITVHFYKMYAANCIHVWGKTINLTNEEHTKFQNLKKTGKEKTFIIHKFLEWYTANWPIPERVFNTVNAYMLTYSNLTINKRSPKALTCFTFRKLYKKMREINTNIHPGHLAERNEKMIKIFLEENEDTVKQVMERFFYDGRDFQLKLETGQIDYPPDFDQMNYFYKDDTYNSERCFEDDWFFDDFFD